jgi:hypothetical protein
VKGTWAQPPLTTDLGQPCSQSQLFYGKSALRCAGAVERLPRLRGREARLGWANHAVAPRLSNPLTRPFATLLPSPAHQHLFFLRSISPSGHMIMYPARRMVSGRCSIFGMLTKTAASHCPQEAIRLPDFAFDGDSHKACTASICRTGAVKTSF